MVHFEYTGDELVLRELSAGIQYNLPKHLNQLLYHIHQVDSHDSSTRLESLDNLQASSKGHDLLRAIAAAKNFQNTHINWFNKTYHREDSAYTSFSTHEDNDDGLESVSEVLDDFTASPPCCMGDDDGEAESCITYNTNYMCEGVDCPLQSCNQDSSRTPCREQSLDAATISTDDINLQLYTINLHSMNAAGEEQGLNIQHCSTREFYPPSDLDTEWSTDDHTDRVSMHVRVWTKKQGLDSYRLTTSNRTSLSSDHMQDESSPDFGRDV